MNSIDGRDSGTEAPISDNRHFLGMAGNERMTALTGAVLLALIPIALLSAELVPQLLTVHIFVGVLLAGPVVVKIGSTGYRIVRYYTRATAYVRRGPPERPLRILGALLIPATLVVMGSGLLLLLDGPARNRSLLVFHGISAVVWLSMLAVHVLLHGERWTNLLVGDWGKRSRLPVPGRGFRVAMNVVALVAGTIAAVILLPHAASWLAWAQPVAIPQP